MLSVVPVLVRSVIASAIPMNGAISVDPVSFTILMSRLFSSKYFLVRFGNSVAIVIPSLRSLFSSISLSSGEARTSFVAPKFKSKSISTSASFSSMRSYPVIPMSQIPSSTNSGMSAARANITSISSL